MLVRPGVVPTYNRRPTAAHGSTGSQATHLAGDDARARSRHTGLRCIIALSAQSQDVAGGVGVALQSASVIALGGGTQRDCTHWHEQWRTRCFGRHTIEREREKWSWLSEGKWMHEQSRILFRLARFRPRRGRGARGESGRR